MYFSWNTALRELISLPNVIVLVIILHHLSSILLSTKLEFSSKPLRYSFHNSHLGTVSKVHCSFQLIFVWEQKCYTTKVGDHWTRMLCASKIYFLQTKFSSDPPLGPSATPYQVASCPFMSGSREFLDTKKSQMDGFTLPDTAELFFGFPALSCSNVFAHLGVHLPPVTPFHQQLFKTRGTYRIHLHSWKDASIQSNYISNADCSFDGIMLIPGCIYSTPIIFLTFPILLYCLSLHHQYAVLAGWKFSTASILRFNIWFWGLLTALFQNNVFHSFSCTCYNPLKILLTIIVELRHCSTFCRNTKPICAILVRLCSTRTKDRWS